MYDYEKQKETINFKELLPDLLLLAYEKAKSKKLEKPDNLKNWEDCITFDTEDNITYAYLWYRYKLTTKVVKITLKGNHFNTDMI